MAFAYHFINSTVHTSKVIWALKTIKKLMNAFYWWEATQLHGTTAPSSGRKLKYPDAGTEGNSWLCVRHLWGWALIWDHLSGRERWMKGSWGLSQISACTHRWSWQSWQGREDRLIQAILHNLAFRDQQVQIDTYTLFKNRGLILNIVKIS